MTPQSQQQYLLITEEELLDLLSFADAHDYQWTKQTEQTIRSRSAPSPEHTISALISENARIGAELKRVIEQLQRLNGEHDAAVAAKAREEKAVELDQMETSAKQKYEFATTKHDEVYQQGIVMGLQMAIKSLRPAPSPSELAATAYQAGIECGREEEAAQARKDLFTLEENEHMVVAIKAQEGWSDCEICKKVLDTLESLRTGGDGR